jgi:Glutathione S-transferase, N-terminal domain
MAERDLALALKGHLRNKVRRIRGRGARMSRLRIYGVARTRAFRAIWMAKELGLDFEHVLIEIGPAGARQPEYLAVNPNGRRRGSPTGCGAATTARRRARRSSCAPRPTPQRRPRRPA